MNKLASVLILVFLTALVAGCSKTGETSQNPNAATETSTKPAPDNSEIATKVDANGVKTEERVFHGHKRISRVVVTTDKNGKRTVKAYSASGEERPVNDSEDVFTATGDKIADGAGFVADKSEDVAGAAKDVGETAKDKTVAVGEKTADTAKTVGSKSVEGAKKVGDKTVSGAKTVGSKTVSGAKKAGDAVKKIIP